MPQRYSHILFFYSSRLKQQIDSLKQIIKTCTDAINRLISNTWIKPEYLPEIEPIVKSNHDFWKKSFFAQIEHGEYHPVYLILCGGLK